MWIFWLLIILVIFWVIKSTTSSGNNSVERSKTALDILKERYARGEINEEEFNKKRQGLSN